MNKLFLTPHFKNNLKYLSNNQIVGLPPKNALLKASTHKKLNAQGLLRF
ncbi:hypothetical protein HPHPP4D_1517 [Helicobacter pylori Hp P-4d]|uniref:Uncharacterized protein n=1 Tax=Helicobacter pylori Hp P-4 TaxID=992075 RepID=J0EQF7_HELPX|nr:hypothetical protein HPHPP4_1304 [Helicobacter pylori Hp P-4]EJC22421.1 hypothetical protein HPHPP4D_1517 [Helicobacter pylori Hp P-4d]EJC23132.1 hypothetical protein HPHPP4C_1327 [Helicobacter pylori Hp P-4c]